MSAGQRVAISLLAAGAACGALACAAREGAAPPPEARAALRRERRAYDGAPPVIPHPVRALQRQECLTCHLQGLEVPGEGLAPRTPHRQMGNCLQCHVESIAAAPALAGNRFEGWRGPGRGTRAYAGAPPTIPHTLLMRQNCVACHGESGGSPIRTPHADRVNCAQCHVARVEPPAGTADLSAGNHFTGMQP